VWTSGENDRLRGQGGNHQALRMKEAKDANPQIPGGTEARRQQKEREGGWGKASSNLTLLPGCYET
jgi:hypothetical protein